MAKRRQNRLDGGAHELIDQILALSHRRLPTRRLAPAHPRDTANTRFMRQAVTYATSALERRDEAAGRQLAERYFAAQDLAGHMCWPGDDPDPLGYNHRIEQLSADPHYTYHVASAALITLAATWWGHSDLLLRGAEWLRRHLELVRRCAAPDGTAAFPATRAKTSPPLWGVASAVLREVLQLPPQRELARKPHLPDEQGWWVPVRLVRLARMQGADLTPRDGELPNLRIPVTVQRFAEGHLAHMGPAPYVRWIAQPVDWVVMRYGEDARRHRVDYGRGWREPPPRLEELTARPRPR